MVVSSPPPLPGPRFQTGIDNTYGWHLRGILYGIHVLMLAPAWPQISVMAVISSVVAVRLSIAWYGRRASPSGGVGRAFKTSSELMPRKF